eukprot:gene30214-35202_t
MRLGAVAGFLIIAAAAMVMVKRQAIRGLRDQMDKARTYLPGFLPMRLRRVVVRTPYGNPLPPVINATIEESDLCPGRVIVVGDVHGCYDELEQLLEVTKFEPHVDNLILAGDLVNKGPKSKQVLNLMHSLGSSAHAVRGNHDDHVLSVYRRWTRTGVVPNERLTWVKQLSSEDGALLSQLPFTISVPAYGLVVVHAMLMPGRSLERMDLWAALHGRNLTHLPLVPRRIPRIDEAQLKKSQEGGVQVAKLFDARKLRWKPIESVDGVGIPWAKLWEGPSHVIFDLRSSSPLFLEKLNSQSSLTLEDLQGEVVSVQAARVYSEVKRKKVAAAEA